MIALPNTSVTTAGGTTSVCAINFPKTQDFASMFSASFPSFSASSLTMPGFSLPSPMFPNVHTPSLESTYAAMSAMSSMAMQAIMALINTIKDYVGLGVNAILQLGSDIFSGIYGFALNVADVLAVDIKKIAASIKAFFASGGHIPGFPSPIFPNISSPSIEAYHSAQLMLTNFWLAVVSAVTSLIGNIKSYITNLQITLPSIPTIPPIPTMHDISASLFTFSGFPFSFTMPTVDMSSNFKSPSISSQLSLGMFMQDILSSIITFVTGVFKQLLDLLGITIPNPFPICVSSPTA